MAVNIHLLIFWVYIPTNFWRYYPTFWKNLVPPASR